MRKKEFKIQMVHLESFISLLMDVYEQGVDFIDIVGFPNNSEDTLRIVMRDEVIGEPLPLTEDIINKLI